MVELGLLPRLGLGSLRALGCPSAVTVAKSIRVRLEPQEFLTQEEGIENVLSSAGSHMEPPASAWWLKEHIEQAFAALENYRCRKAGAGIHACLPAWGGAGQTGTHVSPQQESSLCPAGRRLGSRQDSKCIQCFPSPGSRLGLCNTAAAATGGSDQGGMRFEESRAGCDVSGSPRSAVCRCSLQHLGSLWAAHSFLAGGAWPQAASSPVPVGGCSWLPCRLGAPCPCRALAALTEAGASKQRRQCLLAWLLAGSFLSQYSQASSCTFSKNLVLELGLGVCGVSPVAESWMKALDK